MEPTPWETADRDPEEERPPRSQTRDTRTANSAKRRGWYGLGSLARVEKSGFGRLLDDVVYAYADVTVFSLPALLYVWLTDPVTEAALTTPALLAWMTMVTVATLLRGGWIAPLGSETLGWVSGRYALLPLRIAYYNPVLLAVVYGTVALVPVLGSAVALVCAGFGSVVATLAFPTVADAVYGLFAR